MRKALDTHRSGRYLTARDGARGSVRKTVDSSHGTDASVGNNTGRVIEDGGVKGEAVMREGEEMNEVEGKRDQDELSRHLSAAIQSMTALPAYLTSSSPFDDDAAKVYCTLRDINMGSTNSLLSSPSSSPVDAMDGYALVKRVQITPSRIIAKPAVSMKTSRLIRAFGDDYHLGMWILDPPTLLFFLCLSVCLFVC